MHACRRARGGGTENAAGARKVAAGGRPPAFAPAGLETVAVLVSLFVLSQATQAQSRTAIDMQNRTCTDYGCHADLQTKAILHSPVAKGLCHPCHPQPQSDVHSFATSDPQEAMCQACHTLILKNHVHEPVREGHCLECHDPHQSEFHFLVRADPSQALCLECHADAPFMSRPHLHGPVAMGACILCHAAHSSWKPKLVVGEGNEICAGCHEDRFRRDREARHVHPPATESCDQCHDPHGSDWPAQLLDEPRKLCVTCHDDMERYVVTSEVVHGAIDEGQQCRNCHTGHASSLPSLLNGSLLDTCLRCHNEEIALPEGRTVVNMAALLKANPNHHGPIRQGNCSACHNPHASSHFDLLTEAYPERFYAAYDPDDYRLCFTCHRSEMAWSQDGRGVTEFRDGSLNLHYVHVSKPSRGRTCRACHAVHASKKYAHISESVPYGSWEYAINFELNRQGGTCGPACHTQRSYDRTRDSRTTETPDEPTPDARQPAAMIQAGEAEE